MTNFEPNATEISPDAGIEMLHGINSNLALVVCGLEVKVYELGSDNTPASLVAVASADEFEPKPHKVWSEVLLQTVKPCGYGEDKEIVAVPTEAYYQAAETNRLNIGRQ